MIGRHRRSTLGVQDEPEVEGTMCGESCAHSMRTSHRAGDEKRPITSSRCTNVNWGYPLKRVFAKKPPKYDKVWRPKKGPLQVLPSRGKEEQYTKSREKIRGLQSLTVGKKSELKEWK